MKNLFFALLLLSCRAVAQQCPIVPLPNRAEAAGGNFILNNSTPIVLNQAGLKDEANYLQQELLKTTGLTLSIQPASNMPTISLDIKKSKENNPEAYSLEIKPAGIKITAATERGVFYGLTSLLQLTRLAQVKNDRALISCWSIKDAPKYSWRGVLLDESRHFFGKAVVKELLDWMAFYKLNKFHWHLTDEPGWRLEIKSFPLLSLTGGIGDFSDKLLPARYYTQEDIKEIVAYARERFIDVIPEIDMPGHASAANRAYPAFSGGGSVKNPDFTFNPGKDTTYNYLSKIIKETDALFPSQMIHLGGDEVSFGSEKWKTDPAVKQLMAEKGIQDLVGVEHYFTKRIADSLFKLDNKVLLWDEAAESDLPADKTIIFWWRHDKPQQLKKALDKGYQTVLCPRLPFYFDFVQDGTQRYGRRWQGKYITLDKLYNFTSDSLISKTQQKQVLGVQAALWTENILSTAKLEYMLFPRIAALAETAWTNQDQKDFGKFQERLKGQLLLYQKASIYFYDPFNPTRTPEPLIAKEL